VEGLFADSEEDDARGNWTDDRVRRMMMDPTKQNTAEAVIVERGMELFLRCCQNIIHSLKT
jgi:hypothetical protein